MKRIVVLGGGFGGIAAALRLKKKLRNSSVTVIDKNNYHTFTPALSKLASGMISQEECLINLSVILSKKGVKFLNSEITEIDVRNKIVITKKKKVKYDFLIKSIGSETNFFDIAGAEENSLVLKTAIDAINIRNHIEDTFKILAKNTQKQDKYNLVLIGAGPVGIELAGDIVHYMEDLCNIFNIDHHKTAVHLIEKSHHLLNFNKKFSSIAKQFLNEKGISVHTGKNVKEVKKGRIIFDNETHLDARTIIWVGGIKPNKLIGEEKSRLCCIKGLISNEYLQSVADENIFEAGDSVVCYDEEIHKQIVHNAQTAIDQGRLVADNIIRKIQNKKLNKYIPRKYPVIITLGERNAVFYNNGFVISGKFVSWLKIIIRRHYIYSIKN